MVATTCIQPIDTVKVRLQLVGEGSKGTAPSPLAVGRAIVAKDGVTALWAGLTAGYLRLYQITRATRLTYADK